ncbi:hypothetical protein P175DRAFT_0497205 [Aspergillus ochraceoroseus IBT 24754]|uniref:Uncharacterized protein n=1 Tax=Aspergillus ochraceoroseus IBT 24754 TaxID=1392256 RepID=A0A2T5M6D0_9EURO|nr:uncharacterized protein P175DRAFT_0497205 [Aspergillus ochraceoroseus IBT 24754]PTU24091.1 hypothetical protein P175DRAFT_0497205 [Aspergillus ochraceoroseus IBT 24754]
MPECSYNSSQEADAAGYPKSVNIVLVTSGKTPERTFRQKDCAAMAELAYRW